MTVCHLACAHLVLTSHLGCTTLRSSTSKELQERAMVPQLTGFLGPTSTTATWASSNG